MQQSCAHTARISRFALTNSYLPFCYFWEESLKHQFKMKLSTFLMNLTHCYTGNHVSLLTWLWDKQTRNSIWMLTFQSPIVKVIRRWLLWKSLEDDYLNQHLSCGLPNKKTFLKKKWTEAICFLLKNGLHANISYRNISLMLFISTRPWKRSGFEHFSCAYCTWNLFFDKFKEYLSEISTKQIRNSWKAINKSPQLIPIIT